MTNELGELRDIQQDELAIMLVWRNAPSVRANMYTNHVISFEEHKNWWNRIQKDKKYRYLMFEHQGKPMGIVAITEINTSKKSASWAFYASPDAPKGTGSRMELLALDTALKQMELFTLNCEVLGFNKPVLRLHEKFGFETIEVIADGHSIDGKFCDIHKLLISAEKWSKIRPVVLENLLERWK